MAASKDLEKTVESALEMANPFMDNPRNDSSSLHRPPLIHDHHEGYEGYEIPGQSLLEQPKSSQ
jgi:hypothetical protein